MNPRVSKVTASDDYKLQLVFTNGEQGIYDCSILLNFGVFKELQDKNYFKQVRSCDGTVVWPHEQDICPDTLYLDSKKKSTYRDSPAPSKAGLPHHQPYGSVAGGSADQADSDPGEDEPK